MARASSAQRIAPLTSDFLDETNSLRARPSIRSAIKAGVSKVLRYAAQPIEGAGRQVGDERA
jgi:hypothetical protein